MAVCTVTPAGGGWRNPDIADGAGIEAEKVIHQYTITNMLTATTTTNVSAVTVPFAIIKGSVAELIAFEGFVYLAAGGDRTATVDLQKSTGGGAFASVLGTTMDFDSSDTARVAIAGAINDEDAVEGDLYQVVVTVGGASGTQPQGLTVSLTLQERLA